jgi:hypothetical protein
MIRFRVKKKKKKVFFLIEPSIRAWAGFSKENIPIDSLFVAKEQSNRSKKKKKHTTLLAREREREIKR